MTAMLEILQKAAAHNGLVTAFAVVGFIVLVSGQISRRLTFGRVHGSAIAIVIGLALAYWGGTKTGGHKGLADLSLFGGIGLMGGAMLRDFAILATAFEVQATEARQAGMIGAVSLLLGTVLPYIVGATVARAFGYSDPESPQSRRPAGPGPARAGVAARRQARRDGSRANAARSDARARRPRLPRGQQPEAVRLPGPGAGPGRLPARARAAHGAVGARV